MKDLGAVKQILGMRIIRDKTNGTLKLLQSEYVKKVLSRFNMNEAKPVSTPLGSIDVKLITVAMLSLLTILTSYYCCMWMICLLQGLALRRLII